MTNTRYLLGVVAALLTFAGTTGGQMDAKQPRAQGNAGTQTGELLYNGIRLPAEWPPKGRTLSAEPEGTPQCVTSPPEVIPIDVGRQLFVDDFLIEETSLFRLWHAADYCPNNPIVKPDKPWEHEKGSSWAIPFSDGVWFDPQDNLFKMWYTAGLKAATCYATSRDGIRWEKPSLDVVPGTNIVHAADRDSNTVWMDLEEKDPARRFKLFNVELPEMNCISIYFSPDGIHWTDRIAKSGPCGDRTTVFYNPFRKVWVYSLRGGHRELGRIRNYREHTDVVAGADWTASDWTPWTNVDRLDARRPEIDSPPELYNVDGVAYESVILGLFSVWRGHPSYRHKLNDILPAFTRDGFHWDRACRRPLVTVSERYGDWNWTNVQSAGGCCLVVGDKLYFYVSGRAGILGQKDYGVCATGLATLRRDGFASMSVAHLDGTLTTRPVRFSGRYLFVNVDSHAGELTVEALDKKGRVIAPFSEENCAPIRSDKTMQRVTWRGVKDLSALAGKPVKFRFQLKNGDLYSFWVSPEASGASHGCVAAGGPGFTGPTDTVGSAAYEVCSKGRKL